MMENYILDGHKPVLEPDLMKWAMWFEAADRHVNRTYINIPLERKTARYDQIRREHKLRKKQNYEKSKRYRRKQKPERFFKKTSNTVFISTVFLGVNHSFDDGPPMLFETMVFGGKFDGKQTRCATWKQAEKMHDDMVNKVKKYYSIKSQCNI